MTHFRSLVQQHIINPEIIELLFPADISVSIKVSLPMGNKKIAAASPHRLKLSSISPPQ